VQISNILNGWQNFIAKSEVSEKLAKERAAECAKCPHAKEGKLLAFIKDDLKEIEGYYCDLCKCPLSAKVRSQNENCEDKLW
jgi:hypothetical protein